MHVAVPPPPTLLGRNSSLDKCNCAPAAQAAVRTGRRICMRPRVSGVGVGVRTSAHVRGATTDISVATAAAGRKGDGAGARGSASMRARG